jgi:hypothetical protein
MRSPGFLSKICELRRKNVVKLDDNMNITNTLSVTNRKDWRKWLKSHYKTEKEIWLKEPADTTEKGKQIGFGGVNKYF